MKAVSIGNAYTPVEEITLNYKRYSDNVQNAISTIPEELNAKELSGLAYGIKASITTGIFCKIKQASDELNNAISNLSTDELQELVIFLEDKLEEIPVKIQDNQKIYAFQATQIVDNNFCVDVNGHALTPNGENSNIFDIKNPICVKTNEENDTKRALQEIPDQREKREIRDFHDTVMANMPETEQVVNTENTGSSDDSGEAEPTDLMETILKPGIKKGLDYLRSGKWVSSIKKSLLANGSFGIINDKLTETSVENSDNKRIPKMELITDEYLKGPSTESSLRLQAFIEKQRKARTKNINSKNSTTGSEQAIESNAKKQKMNLLTDEYLDGPTEDETMLGDKRETVMKYIIR